MKKLIIERTLWSERVFESRIDMDYGISRINFLNCDFDDFFEWDGLGSATYGKDALPNWELDCHESTKARNFTNMSESEFTGF